MLPAILCKYLFSAHFPQRLLLSGDKTDTLRTAFAIAAKLQETTEEAVQSGIHSDTMICRDIGESFKIGDPDAPETESVRGLIHWCHEKPNEGKYRIVILENFERLSHDAPHAFLKLLEEPPSFVVFLFTTQNHHQLLDTILSRLTVVRLPRPRQGDEPHSDADGFFKTALIGRFKTIESLNKESKESGEKMDRSVFYDFMENLMRASRQSPPWQENLELLFETRCAIEQNVNPRLALERMAMKMKGNIL